MSKILVQLSGSIAAYKSCYLISKLVQAGHEVKTVATKGALEFVGAATLEGLSGSPVFHDIYEEGRMMDHIHLAKWADLSILAPASANTINRLAQGLADDVVGTLFLAWDLKKKPYLVAPAMNQQMMDHPATKEALSKLEGWGAHVLPSGDGHQACGDTGLGRLLEPDQLFAIISKEIGK
jgi:phosphopantothenoylcysteine decarboxylase/phosphopantothenate--cysteine ligase